MVSWPLAFMLAVFFIGASSVLHTAVKKRHERKMKRMEQTHETVQNVEDGR